LVLGSRAACRQNIIVELTEHFGQVAARWHSLGASSTSCRGAGFSVVGAGVVELEGLILAALETRKDIGDGVRKIAATGLVS
jgi:hypothetical protein